MEKKNVLFLPGPVTVTYSILSDCRLLNGAFVNSYTDYVEVFEE